MHSKLEDIETEMDADAFLLREQHFGDMNIGYEIFHEHLESDEMFADLPDGRCQSPHWGYVLEGEFRARYADGEETVKAGEVYYMKPGHNVTLESGTKLVEFSPIGEFAKTLDAATSKAKPKQVMD